MGLTLDLGMEKGNIACHKSGARGGFPTARGTPREPGFGDEAFWRSQVNFGPPNPATDEKDRGSVYVVTLPAFKRCLEDGPDAAERRPRSGFPTSRGTGDGHLEAHHDLQARPARPGKATRLGVRGSIVPAASRTSYSSFLKAGVRDLFSATEKNQRSRFDSAQPNDTSNTNDLVTRMPWSWSFHTRSVQEERLVFRKWQMMSHTRIGLPQHFRFLYSRIMKKALENRD